MRNAFDIKAAWDVVRCVAWVCQLARISIGGTLAGFAILLVPDQSRDIILAAGEDWGWGNFANFTLALLFWAFGAWAWARVLVVIKRTRPEMLTLTEKQRNDIIDGAIAWVPRVIAAAVFILVAIVFATIGLQDLEGPARDADILRAAASHRAVSGAAPGKVLVSYAGFLAVLGLAVMWFLSYRRDLATILAENIREPRLQRLLLPDNSPSALNKGNRETVGLSDLNGLTLTLLGFYVATGIAVMTWFVIDPVSAGWSFGSANLIALGVTQIIAALSFLAFWTDRWRFPIFTALVGVALVFSFWMDNHGLREISPVSTAPEPRLDVTAALGKWREAQKRPQDAPLVIVATAGGGITAAYWTASVLGGLEDAYPGFHRHIFGISSVSGGSLGATVFRALLTHKQKHKRLPCKANTFQACAREMLAWDSLSPTLGSMLYPDLLQRFLPIAVFEDRAAALEETWERAWARTATEKGTDKDLFAGRFDDLWSEGPLPALFLNGTSVKTGRRIITSNLAVDSNGAALQPFPDALDFNAITDIAIRPSTAANNSARFPIVGPPGSIPHSRSKSGTGAAEQIVDGGYFENFGATTGLDITVLARRALPPTNRIIFIQISSDASLSLTPNGDLAAPVPAGGFSWGSELRAPPSALLQTRSARGLQEVALTQSVIAQEFGGTFVHFALSKGCGDRAPLGWVLSNYARESLNQAWSRPTCAKPRAEALIAEIQSVKPLAAAE
ncbi:MAG TPA: hypothetical protein VEX87_21495 [Skermanella sp.]|nr:hypothetical protein [Skermanella sp.]